ncbi:MULTISPECIES: ReoY family proteolytic degradation factor [Listeria]|uniref:ReoY family proteolytic degradation factor n=1 Tax=Listeria TaxID=1637 RepID=UPI000B590585|nr:MULTISPECIES: ReoY family proteolytic degradation factor [Listeria]
MKASISVDEKKDFIRWLLNTHQMKMREAMWVLNYIAGHDQIIQYVHFVDDLEGCNRGLVLSAEGVDFEPFRFFKGKLTTSNPEKAFHDIRLNWDEELYIVLHFSDALSSPEYALVREDNPHKDLQIGEEEQQLATDFLDRTLSSFMMESVQKEIDRAIDAGDKERFLELTAFLKEMKE